jgi:SRSO17 transposase
VAAGHSVDAGRWDEETDRLLDRMAGRFARVETRRRVRGFVLGLLADLPRKNCWSIAEHVGDRDPHGMQHFLARASWDTDGVRDDLRSYVVSQLGDPDAVLVFDETGDLKKGTCTVGVQRQYTGTAGRIENAQVAVYLTYAAARGHTLIDRELYLPQSWTTDSDRLAEAGVPDDIDFATKPALAIGMLTRALRAAVPARWATGDEVYGNDPNLRAECEAQQIGYVLAIGCDRRVPTPRPDPRRRPDCRAAALGVPAALGRTGRERRALLRLGVDHPHPRQHRHRHQRHGVLVAAGPATAAPVTWRSTAATPRRSCRCASWSGLPAAAGRSRSRSRLARAWPGSTSTRSAAGLPGDAGRCCR